MVRGRKTTSLHESPASYGAGGSVVTLPASLLDVGVLYMQELRDKALRVSSTLAHAGVPHAVIGGLAVAAHVARVDATAQRNTQDLNLLLNRAELDRAKAAFASIGYRYRKVMKLHAFMPEGKGHRFADGIHLIWAGEKVREEYPVPAPMLDSHATFASQDGVQYLGLFELLTMKLTSFRLKDQVHIQDLLLLKLVSKKIEHALPEVLQARLQQVKDDTERERLG